jgi:hypothetical protein
MTSGFASHIGLFVIITAVNCLDWLYIRNMEQVGWLTKKCMYGVFNILWLNRNVKCTSFSSRKADVPYCAF